MVNLWNRLWDRLSNPLCWEFLKTEERVGGCKGNWWYFCEGTMSEEPPRHTSVWCHCWKVMLAAVQWRGKEFRGEGRWGRVHALCNPLLVQLVWQLQRNLSYGTHRPRGPACPLSCSSPPEVTSAYGSYWFPLFCLRGGGCYYLWPKFSSLSYWSKDSS